MARSFVSLLLLLVISSSLLVSSLADVTAAQRLQKFKGALLNRWAADNNVDLANLRYPLDEPTRQVFHENGLITNMPNENTEAPFVITPFGVFGRECVHGTEPGAKVTEIPESGDLFVELQNGTSYVYASSQYRCKERFDASRLKIRREKLTVGAAAPAWQDGWIANGWYFSSNEVGSFTADYTVPQTPATQSNQVLFWFIGIESQNSDLTILQPVLTWNNIVSGWSFASWYCCPSGTPNYATPVQGFNPGDTLHGTIKASQPTTGSDFTVNYCVGSNCSPLSCPASGRIFTSVDTTLETYSITDCSEFATGPMTFSNMALADINNQGITPQWQQVTGATECSGSINFSGDSCVIQHSG